MMSTAESGTKRPVALITGGGRGIGRATAIAAARAGYDVGVNYVDDDTAAEATAASCRELGAISAAVRGDVADAEAVAQMFQSMDRIFGRLDLLVNNAGIVGKVTKVADLDAETLKRTFEVNVFGTVYCVQEAILRMSREHGGDGGAIVNLSSIAATLGSAGEYVHYAASKGAIETFTLGLAKEVAPVGIRVNAVQAGTTDTEIHARSGNPDRPSMVAKMVPLGRVATPDDIAQAILWLASDAAAYTTGASLRVGGGL
ncbi:MAG: SDR family oxidoreductase [Pseudomonadota bacterium]